MVQHLIVRDSQGAAAGALISYEENAYSGPVAAQRTTRVSQSFQAWRSAHRFPAGAGRFCIGRNARGGYLRYTGTTRRKWPCLVLEVPQKVASPPKST